MAGGKCGGDGCGGDSNGSAGGGGHTANFANGNQDVTTNGTQCSSNGSFFNGRIVRLVSNQGCLLYTSPSPRDRTRSRMPSSA